MVQKVIDKDLILGFAQDIHAIIKPDVSWEDVPETVRKQLCCLVAYLYYNGTSGLELLELDQIVVNYLKGKGA